MLVYIYTDSVEITESNYVPLLDVAKKFEVRDLILRIVDFLLPRITPHNCVAAWLNAIEIPHPTYEAKALTVMARHLPALCTHPDLVSNIIHTHHSFIPFVHSLTRLLAHPNHLPLGHLLIIR